MEPSAPLNGDVSQPAGRPKLGLVGLELQLAGPRGGTISGTLTECDPNRPKYDLHLKYDEPTVASYKGQGEWGSLDESSTTWLTHGFKRRVVKIGSGAGAGPSAAGASGGSGQGAVEGGKKPGKESAGGGAALADAGKASGYAVNPAEGEGAAVPDAAFAPSKPGDGKSEEKPGTAEASQEPGAVHAQETTKGGEEAGDGKGKEAGGNSKRKRAEAEAGAEPGKETAAAMEADVNVNPEADAAAKGAGAEDPPADSAEGIVGTSVELAGPRGGKSLCGTITEHDPERPKYKVYMQYDKATASAYKGKGEWGSLDEGRTTWLTHGYKRRVVKIGSGAAAGGSGAGEGIVEGRQDGGSRKRAKTEPKSGTGAAAKTTAKGAGHEAGGAGTKKVDGEGAFDPVSTTVELAGPRGGKSLCGTITEHDPDRPKFKSYLQYDKATAAAYKGHGEWGSLDESRTTWLTHGYKRRVVKIGSGAGAGPSAAGASSGAGEEAGDGSAGGGTSAHLNLGLSPEQRLVLDQLSLEQLQAYIKGRGKQ